MTKSSLPPFKRHPIHSDPLKHAATVLRTFDYPNIHSLSNIPLEFRDSGGNQGNAKCWLKSWPDVRKRSQPPPTFFIGTPAKRNALYHHQFFGVCSHGSPSHCWQLRQRLLLLRVYPYHSTYVDEISKESKSHLIDHLSSIRRLLWASQYSLDCSKQEPRP